MKTNRKPYGKETRNWKQIKKIAKEARGSKWYKIFVSQHKTLVCSCDGCENTDNLELHHTVPLETIISHLIGDRDIRIRKNFEAVSEALQAAHDNEQIIHETICSKCHDKRHGIKNRKDKKPTNGSVIRLKDWFGIPRNYSLKYPTLKLIHSKKDVGENGLGLVSTKILFALGGEILNRREKNIVKITYEELAATLKKKNSDPCRKSIRFAFDRMRGTVIDDYYERHNVFHIYISREYINDFKKDAWYIHKDEMGAKTTYELAIIWYLRQKESSWQVHLNEYSKHDWLKKILGITGINDSAIKTNIIATVKRIPWLSATIKQKKRNVLFSFRIDNRKRVYFPNYAVWKYINIG